MDAETTSRGDLCHMKCPKCGNELAHFSMSGVELDRCTKCGGIWFDPGELDDLLEEHWSVMKEVFGTFREKSS
jgi:Zn-finger nucleic acid-binding protein